MGVFQRKGGKGGESAEKAEHHHRQIRSQSFILLPEQHVDQSGDEGAENIDRHRRERQRIAAGCGQEADRRHPAERAERSGRHDQQNQFERHDKSSPRSVAIRILYRRFRKTQENRIDFVE